MRWAPRIRVLFVGASVVAGVAACATVSDSANEARVARSLEERTGHASRPSAGEPGEIPPRVDLADGVSDEECVALALWNDAGFRAALAQLAIARADVLEAGLLADPALSFLFPLGPKQMEATLSWPLERLLTRERRVNVANLDAESIAESLVQNGLELVRDTKRECAEWRAARACAHWTSERAELEAQLATLARKRLAAGAISAAQAQAAAAQARAALDEAQRRAGAVEIARARVWAHCGFGAELPDAELVSGAPELERPLPSLAQLLAHALTARPDLRASELSFEAAAASAGIAPEAAWRIAGIVDANWKGTDGFEAGPGVALTLPIVNGGRGLEARAKAQLEQAQRNLEVTRQRVQLDVRETYLKLASAGESRRTWRDELLPALERAARCAEAAYRAGETTLAESLDAQRALADARCSASEVDARWQVALAELERSVGRSARGLSQAIWNDVP